MAASQAYNPTIIGFVEKKGFVSVPLQAAREEYGELPSDYGLVPRAPGRRPRKALNLPLGFALLALLRERGNVAETVSRFAEHWGRDFRADFGLDVGPLQRMNDPHALKRLIAEYAEAWERCQALDVSEYLHRQKLVPLPTLRSIPPPLLLEKAREILAKKQRNPAHRHERERLGAALEILRSRQVLEEVAALTGSAITRLPASRLAVHADEIARLLCRLPELAPLQGREGLRAVRGQGVEFAYAPRDGSFVALGKQVGDCTADKAMRQVDQDVENIYWTVFTWLLDWNYQILKVYVDGQFVMKVHLLPLLVTSRHAEFVMLGVDAIETTPGFREDTPESSTALLADKEQIFNRTMREIRRIAAAMGIAYVFAERFSNTGWVREELAQFPEVYLHVEDVRKIDELEDVFELGRRLAASSGAGPVRSVFMELQMRNTQLQRGVANVKGVKAFACIAGDPRVGLSLKRVSGI
jgi:hypothetical protein